MALSKGSDPGRIPPFGENAFTIRVNRGSLFPRNEEYRVERNPAGAGEIGWKAWKNSGFRPLAGGGRQFGTVFASPFCIVPD